MSEQNKNNKNCNTSENVHGYNHVCYKCTLDALNRFREYGEGDYAKQFNLDVNPQNKSFAQNPYKYNNECTNTNVTCFDIKYGLLSSRPYGHTTIGAPTFYE